MAQWTFVDPNTLLPGDPWTSAKAQAAFENLEAVAEGAPDAPRVQGSALGTLLGFGVGSTTYLNVDENAVIHAMYSGSGSNLEVSSDGGSTFSGIRTASDDRTVFVIFNTKTGEFCFGRAAADGSGGVGTISGGPFNAVRIPGGLHVAYYVARGDAT